MNAKRMRSLFTGFLSIALLVQPIPKASAVSLAEYPVLLVLILFLSDAAAEAPIPPAWQTVAAQLQTAVEGAKAANVVGDSTTELTRLSKAIGAAQALIGMTASCGDCNELRNDLQKIIGLATLLRTRIVGASSTCGPNAIVQRNEQCDPLAVPTGCPTSPTAATYCSDECRCESSIIP